MQERRAIEPRQRQASATALAFDILAQPDDTTCGPTCLHAVYRYYGDKTTLRNVITEVPALDDGGTLGIFLAMHALRRGYQATMYTYNLNLFDPTWFSAPGVDLSEKLRAQAAVKPDPKFLLATNGYLEFLAGGGKVRFEELTPRLVREYLIAGRPILTGLSATYLYQTTRERPDTQDDDVAGEPTGHFVVLCGYDRAHRTVRVADPMQDNPFGGRHLYDVNVERVLGAILLGVLTYDANLLVIEPRGPTEPV